jgi:hypothetical protein
MALTQKFHTNHRLVYKDKNNKTIVVAAGSDDFQPENASQRDSLLKSGAIRPLKAKAETPAEKDEADKTTEAAKNATGSTSA